MHTQTLRKLYLALLVWIALRSAPLRAGDQTVSGNLTVTGTADVQGNTMGLGTRVDTSAEGWVVNYTDGTTSFVDLEANRSANIWRWWQNGGATLGLQMTLDNNNKLVLYDQSSTPNAKITLNPLGTSTLANSVTINGTDNEMPNQTLVNANSVLTESLGDARYVPLSAESLALGMNATANGANSVAFGSNSNAYGSYSFAEGSNASATGPYSIAMGLWSTASGNYSTATGSSYAAGSYSTAMGNSRVYSNYSTAMGSSVAEGNYSTAMGSNSFSSGNGSTALGWSSTASGNYSTAMGESTASGYCSTALGRSTASGSYSSAIGASGASGSYSTASGYFTHAQAYDSCVVGAWNVGGGDPDNWIASDPLFEVGNGSWQTQSDAFVVYKNGNVTAQGVITAAPGGDIPMYTGN